MTTKTVYRKVKRCCTYKLEFPAPKDRAGNDSSDTNALYLYLQPMSCFAWNSTFSLAYPCAIISQAPNKDFLREIFSPNPSKNRKSQKTQSRMAACSWSLLLCRRDAAPEGTHGPLPLLLQTSLLPTSLFPSPHQLSHTLENFLISRGQPKAQQAAEAEARLALPGLMFSQDQSIAAAQHKTTLWSRTVSLSDRHTQNESQNPKVGWVGKDPTAPLFCHRQGHLPLSQESLSSLNLDASRDGASPTHTWGVQSLFSFTTVIIPAYKQDIIMKKKWKSSVLSE